MSFSNIPVNLPDPFFATSQVVSQFPLSRVGHVSGSTVVTTASSLAASAFTTPLVFSGSGTFPLPTAASLFHAFGGVKSVRDDDVFTVPVVNATNGNIVFTASGNVTAGSNLTCAAGVSRNLVIQFTNVSTPPDSNLACTATVV